MGGISAQSSLQALAVPQRKVPCRRTTQSSADSPCGHAAPYADAETKLTVLPDTSLAAGAGGISAQSSLQAGAVSQPKVPTFAGKVQKDVLLSAKKPMLAIKFYWNFLRMEKSVFIHIFSVLFLDSNTVYTCQMEKGAKGNRPKKSCVTSFRKKEAKVGQKPCGVPCEGMVAACEGWWLRVRDGGCVRGMVAACEGWWLRARDGT